MLRTYELSRAPGGAPLYEQLYRAIRADILSGQLAGGKSCRPAGRWPSI